MAHFAKIENNIVKEIIVIDNSDCGDKEFPESEIIGQQFIASLGLDGSWKQTSYNNNFRKQYAGINFVYDETNDIFISPQPHPSWQLDENFDWQPPTPMPENGMWTWNEANTSWVAYE